MTVHIRQPLDVLRYVARLPGVHLVIEQGGIMLAHPSDWVPPAALQLGLAMHGPALCAMMMQDHAAAIATARTLTTAQLH